MPELSKNFAVSTVVTPPSPATSGTTLVIASGEDTRFPPTPFNMVVQAAGVLPTPSNAEVVRVTNIAGNTFTIARAQESSTARTIVAGDVVFAGVTAKTLSDLEDIGFIRLRTQGSAGNGVTDDAATLQSSFDANRSENLWMDGEGLTYATASPLVLGPSQKLRHITLIAKTGYTPAETPMVMNAQGGVLSFTADASTDVFTCPSAHDLPADDVMVLFKGAAIPTGITKDTVYFVRDRTATTFKVSATEGGAAVDLTSAGDGTVYLEVQSLQKVYLDDVHINGNAFAEVGARLYLQQQSILRKLRIDGCTDTGLHLAGQQAVVENFEAIGNGSVGLALDNASFMYFHGFNVEGSQSAVYVWGSVGLFGGGAFSCLFSGVHIEQQGLANAIALDLDGQHDQLVFDNVSASLNVASQKMLYQYSGSVTSSGYTLRNVKVVGGALPAATMIQDDDRGITLNAWDDFRYRIEEFHAPAKPTSDAYTDPGPLSVVLPAGGYIRYGATMPTVPKMDFRPSTGQTGAQTVWRNTGGTAVADIDPAGKLTVPEFKLTGASPGVGKVLTSDADGDAAWETAAASGIPGTIVDAKGDLITATADDAPARLAVGTNDHVLTADSSAATGIKWAAAAGGGIAATIVDAKGDLIAATAADTVARLAVGSNDQVLTADSAQSTGVKWATPSGGTDTGLRLPGTLITGKPISVGIGIGGGAGTFAVNRVMYVPWQWIDRTRSFDQFEINVTAFAASSTVRFGLYADNGGRPGSLTTDYGTTSTDTSNGIKTLSASLTGLTAALYWVAVCFQGGTPTVLRLQPVALGMPVAYSDQPWAVIYEDSISGALPSTATPQYNLGTNWPAVCVRTA